MTFPSLLLTSINSETLPENAKDIAVLLNDKSKKGDAAKALALLGAKEYADEIALLLKDESSLVRKDAALSLGILKAKKYSSRVAELLTTDKESFVENYAAASLILMEAMEYYKVAVPILENPFSDRAYLTDSAFHPLVLEKSNQVTANLKKYLKMQNSYIMIIKGENIFTRFICYLILITRINPIQLSEQGGENQIRAQAFCYLRDLRFDAAQNFRRGVNQFLAARLR